MAVRRLGFLAAVTLAASLAGCDGGGSGGSGDAGPPSRPGPEVAVASFNFPESRLLAEIYAQAMEHAGIPVRRELGLGPRELVQPALQQGFVDFVPEYAGTALAGLPGAAGVDATDIAAVRDALEQRYGELGLRVLAPAEAANQNGLVVTRETAVRLPGGATSDLAGVARDLAIGGPPECPVRPYCLLGLERAYGLSFERFVPLDGEDRTRRALDDGVIDVGVMFTTDGTLAGGDYVLLDDDRRLQPADNVIPVVSGRVLDRYGSDLTTAVDAVSARLSTAALRFLNWRVTAAGKDAAAEARAWLRRHGLTAPP